jgi:eukaryotic-like serine/threonine-protein kinase
MANHTAGVAEYCSLLSKSKLMPPEEVDAVHRRWKDETGGGNENVEAFSKFLVSRRVLTPWQAAMVQRGRADGFFLERYKILDQIGKGQMGGVYKAVHSLGQMVALKILPASRARDARVLGRFQREARLLTQLDHPNVVRAFHVGESAGRHFIVMEFLEGETLDEVLVRRKKLPVGEAVRLVRQTLDGLQHLHSRNMVHRDLKPSNLMILPSGVKGADTTWESTIKILDIGLGRELFDESAPEGLIDTQITVEGAVVGTPDYMAPEQAKDARSADIRADIYSLGCVLYRTITGRTPFPDTNIMTQMLRHATENPLPLANFAEVPPGLQQVLDKLIAKRPEDRYQTPAEGAEALKRFQTTGVGSEPAKPDMTPAFQQWLESEAQAMPSSPLPSEGSKPNASLRPGTNPAAPLPPQPKSPPKAPPASPKPPAPSRQPVPLSGPPPGAPAYPVPPGAPRWQAQPIPYPGPPAASDEEVDVELVTLPDAGVQPNLIPLDEPGPRSYGGSDDDRPLTDLSRRDWFFLSIGGFGVVSAMGVGFALTRLLRGSLKPPEDDAENKE